MKIRMKKLLKNKLFLIILGVAGIVIVLVVRGGSSEPFETIRIERGSIVEEVIVTGTTKPAERVNLAFEKVGIVSQALVSVVERTKEIGLRKAVGATNKDILSQFLIEAIILSLVGGVVGIVAGSVVTVGVYFVLVNFLATGWTFALPLSAIGLAFSVATVTGLIFGIYPARQAANRDPIDALRYE